jgi:DNA polymerase III subunit epsilon
MNNDKQRAAKWAFDLISHPDWVLVDCETTGLDRESQICEIAVLHPSGNTLLDTRVKPTVPIPPDASRIHGIKDEDVVDAPTFEQVLLLVMKAVGKLNVVFFNAEFEMKLIKQSLRPYGIQLAFPNSDRRQCRIFTNGGSIMCAMLQYSQWIGEWNESKGDYKWQKLPGGDHSALGDCRATLNVIRQMAASYQMLEPVSSREDEQE